MSMKYVLYGAGKRGAAFYNKHKDDYDIAYFADSDPMKQGTKYMSLDVISPSRVTELGLMPIVTIKCIDENARMELMKQLFDVGVKGFCFPVNNGLLHFDFTQYDSLDEKPNKICVLGNRCAGQISKALYINNPFTDIEVVGINKSNKDSEYYYHYLTGSLIITHVIEPCEGKKSIELWHGFTIKTLYYMANSEFEKETADENHLELMKKDAICSLSKLYSIFFGYCCNVPYDKFHITGYPRNDMLITVDGRKNLEKVVGKITHRHILFYLPTYRESANGKNGMNKSLIFDMPLYKTEEFDSYLQENSILFIYKTHTIQRSEELLPATENILKITDSMLFDNDLDLYEILNAADCLISDYSSVIIDFLLTDKPMIFTPLDLDEYAETRGFMTEPYDAWMPGEIALDYPQLTKAIDNALFCEDSYKDDRMRMKRIMHKYTDAKSSQRVLALAREILGIDNQTDNTIEHN